MLPQHSGAGARRCDDIVKALECLDDLPGDILGIGTVTGIIRRLAAADLRIRNLDDAAGALQELYGRETDRWAEEINEAGDEEADAQRP